MSEILRVLTANRLADGVVIYGDGKGGWVERLEHAAIFDDKGAAEAVLEGAAADVAAQRIVEPYLFDVERNGAGIHPKRVREVIRAAGPTVRRDLGKQACTNNA